MLAVRDDGDYGSDHRGGDSNIMLTQLLALIDRINIIKLILK